MVFRVQQVVSVILFLTVTFSLVAKEISVANQAFMLLETAEKYHYSPRPVDETFSEEVYRNFLRMLDPHGLLFTTEAIGKMEKYRYETGNQIKQKKTTFLESATSHYINQLRFSDSLIRQLDKRIPDILSDDTLWLGKEVTYVKQSELHRRWEKWIRYMVLWSYQTESDSSEKTIQPTRDKTEKFLKDAIEREICRIQMKLKSAEGAEKLTEQTYLKAISLAFDQHTQYLSLVDKERLEAYISTRSPSFGIALGYNEVGEIEVVEVIPGGPAWNSNEINEGDVLLDIRMEDSATIDLRCATLFNVHDFLLSAGGKKADFRIRKKSGQLTTVSLKRTILEVEENTIRSYVLKGKRMIGYIYMPSFYTGFSYADFISRGCANDLARELIRLRRSGIDGLILDLSDNSGGAMHEALRIAGAFIDHGSICIARSREKEAEVIRNDARGMIFGGPLVLLVNSSSASASELLASVLQDYNRALIVGSKTVGKNSMQNILPVDAGRFDSLSNYKGKPPGFIKLTTGAFYRVTGESHQNSGVVPDIELPDLLSTIRMSNESFSRIPDFEKIKKRINFKPARPLPVGKLRSLSQKRLEDNQGFATIKTMGALFPPTDTSFPIPLSFHKFTRYFNRFKELSDGLSADERSFSVFLADHEERKNLMTESQKEESRYIEENIRDDLYINEAFHIINDLIDISARKEEK